ncbi:DUF2852 domain-containing protein [Wenxinia saemankumensis]|uniref:DUF2852 domain-containing protein n=1 Tax=Wenxinia saemankumensis TaxID=1447782 RepID=A0A1M6AIH4_9RHOB|nr:DUF2852 domain-containing protein [Wenxinia saemankumensis]SHI36128.1 Protein of unknown function [Wenxinia saemankumensis]
MSSYDTHPPRHRADDLTVQAKTWLGKTEAWLDDRGKGAWIAAMVLGFIAFWPIGLALLAYMIWSKRMFSSNCSSRRSRRSARSFRGTGNAAFDAYRSDTLRRLEDEQAEFEAFLARLREARDKAEFDEFMDERAKRAGRPTGGDDPERDAA